MLRRNPVAAPSKGGQKPASSPARPSRSGRAAPSASPLGVGTAFGRQVTSGLGKFLYDTRAELKKVVWPTREQAMNLTALVIGVSIVVGAFIGGVDALLQQIFQILLHGA
jgi:preprotein translocase subunit SecE